MSIHLAVIISIALLGSYFSFFNPAVLSSGIERLENEKQKWIWSAGISSILLVTFAFVFQTGGITEITFYIYCWLLFIAAIDAYSGIIPNRLLYVGVTGWLIILIFFPGYIEHFIPAFACALLLIVIRMGSKKIWGKPGFGWGDIKLIFVLGLLISCDIFLVFYIAILSGGVFSVLGILLTKLDVSSKLSFAPHIIMGFLLIEAFNFFYR